MRTAALGLKPSEIQRLLAEVDEDGNGKVSYAEFIPIATDVIQAMRTRHRVQAEEQRLSAEVEAAASALVNGMPKAQVIEIARVAFELYDADKSGQLSRQELRAVLRDARLGLNAKQVRLVMSSLDVSGDGQLSFDEFSAAMVDVLTEYYKHELRVVGFDELEQSVRDLFAAGDYEGKGVLYRTRMVDVLMSQDVVLLSRMQANTIVAMAPMEEDGGIIYEKVVPVVTRMLRALCTPESLTERARMLERADFAPVELMNGKERAQMEAEFATAFAKHDVDKNSMLVRARGRPPAVIRRSVPSAAATARARRAR